MISLSLVGRGLTVAVLLAGLALAASQGAFSLERLRRGAGGQSEAATVISRRLIVYRLDPARPTTFRFTQPVKLVRIITHPVLAKGVSGQGESFVYAVHAELLDGLGQVVGQHDVHARTTLFDGQGRRIGPFRFYRGSDEVIALSDEVRIASARPFSAIRLTSAGLGKDLAAIDIRISERRPLFSASAASTFQRYSPDDRARLAAPNAFPPELLTEAERANIAISQWRPVGPTGIDGRDHRMRVLYEESGGDPRLDPEDGE